MCERHCVICHVAILFLFLSLHASSSVFHTHSPGLFVCGCLIKVIAGAFLPTDTHIRTHTGRTHTHMYQSCNGWTRILFTSISSTIDIPVRSRTAIEAMKFPMAHTYSTHTWRVPPPPEKKKQKKNNENNKHQRTESRRENNTQK